MRSHYLSMLCKQPYIITKTTATVILNDRASLSERSEESACLFGKGYKVKSRSFDYARTSLHSV
jgi:hypothetical protein